jgi:carbamoyl-phosphate synthase large subunit
MRQIEDIVTAESRVRAKGIPNDAQDMLALKKMGFSDKRLAELAGKKETDVAAQRRQLNVRPVYKRIDTCAGEFASPTPYMYSWKT